MGENWVCCVVEVVMCCGGGDAWPRRKLENSVERGVAASHHILMMAVMKLEAMIPGEPAMDDRRRGGGKTFSFPPMRRGEGKVQENERGWDPREGGIGRWRGYSPATRLEKSGPGNGCMLLSSGVGRGGLTPSLPVEHSMTTLIHIPVSGPTIPPCNQRRRSSRRLLFPRHRGKGARGGGNREEWIDRYTDR